MVFLWSFLKSYCLILLFSHISFHKSWDTAKRSKFKDKYIGQWSTEQQRDWTWTRQDNKYSLGMCIKHNGWVSKQHKSGGSTASSRAERWGKCYLSSLKWWLGVPSWSMVGHDQSTSAFTLVGSILSQPLDNKCQPGDRLSTEKIFL